MTSPMWTPDPEVAAKSNLSRFMDSAAKHWAEDFADYDALHAWSVDEREKFWSSIWDFCGVIGDKGDVVCTNREAMPGARFFPNATLNFAQNLLRRCDDSDAIVFWAEDQVKRRVSWSGLYDTTSRIAEALDAFGLQTGDRCAGMIPNMPEAVMGMLATAARGGVWTSCSPDFGVQGVLDRFGQTEPRVLFTSDGYFYGAKSHDIRAKVAEIIAGLPSVEKVVVVPMLSAAPDISMIPNVVLLDDFLAGQSGGDIDFVQMPFNAPLYIMYSSGTTGAPKCIVHSIGGALVQHLKEQQLHCNVCPGDRVFWFTTCGWMMWNWLVSNLASEATLLLYDGSPFHPRPDIVFDFVDATKMTWFGTSAKYIDACKKAGLRPVETHSMASVRSIGVTGSVLVPESFDYIYDAVKPGVHLASTSGGTDLLASFVTGLPIHPVWRGEIQVKALGLAVEVWDDQCNSVIGQKGELVCTKPFPSMPIGFWRDEDGARYHNAYFAKFDNVWAHGDFAEITEHGGMMIFGRSDATLNPGGVRIGTAEIYREVEQFDEVLEAVAIGQQWNADTRIILFVRLQEGAALTEDLIRALKVRVRTGASPRHVPAKIIAVDDIPRTKSGKITELAIRDIVAGRKVKNAEALANAEALDLFRNLPELST